MIYPLKRQALILGLTAFLCTQAVAALFAADVNGEIHELKQEQQAIESRIDSMRDKIVAVKSDREVFEYVINLVNRAKGMVADPRLKFSRYAAEIAWVEKEINAVQKRLRANLPRVAQIESRLYFVDRDIAVREVMESLQTQEASQIRASLVDRKQNRDDYMRELQDIQGQQKLQQLKLDLIMEYRNALERNRWRRFVSQFSYGENIADVVFYVLKRLLMTVLVLCGLFGVYYFLRGKKSWGARAEKQGDPGLRVCLMQLFFSSLKLAALLGFLLAFLQIWDFGLSRIDVLIRFLQTAHFNLGSTQVTVMALGQAVLIVWIFWTAAKLLNSILASLVYPKTKIEPSLQYSYSVIIGYAFSIVGFMVGLHVLGIPLSSLSLFTGALGIGIGFGLQDLIKNFMAGLMMLVEREVKVGDLIQVGDLPGKVREINAQNTVVDSFDNISVVVPNAEFTGQRIVNWSRSDRVIRTYLSVGVAYGSNTDLVKKTLLAVAESHPKVLKQRASSVIFEGFGDSSLNFKLFVWIDEPENRLSILSDLYFAVDREFRTLKIEIPFPQRDLHTRSSVGPLLK